MTEDINMISLTKHRIQVLINIDKICWKSVSDNSRVYLHVIFSGISTIQQGLISCPLEDGPKDFKYHFVKQLKSYRKRVVEDSDI